MLKSTDFNQDPSLDATIERFIREVSATLDKRAAPGQPSFDGSLNQKEKLAPLELASLIDHTLLKPEATAEDMRRMCSEARQFGFAAVCVNSAFVGLVSELLQGSSTLPITVVGFPLGACSTASKRVETRQAIHDGAREIDLVIHWGALRGKDYRHVLDDIREVVRAAQPFPVKAILETAALSRDEKLIACALSVAAGAAFVKTSTGFGPGGATAEDVALLRQIVGAKVGVKASGGIRTYDDALKMIQAGATRIGSSEGARFIQAELSAIPSMDGGAKM